MCWFNVGPPSATLAHHWTSTDSTCCVYWDIPEYKLWGFEPAVCVSFTPVQDIHAGGRGWLHDGAGGEQALFHGLALGVSRLAPAEQESLGQLWSHVQVEVLYGSQAVHLVTRVVFADPGARRVQVLLTTTARLVLLTILERRQAGFLWEKIKNNFVQIIWIGL